MDILEYNYTLYDKDPNRNLEDPDVTRLHQFHFQRPTDNADVWRQYRLMEPIFRVLAHTKARSWLTVGDGAYGLDSIRMRREGFHSVLPTDIDEKLLKVALNQGQIDSYRVENAERMTFDDESFDFILCKDSFHHFPRPYIALYEMIRVARTAVVLIEPQDPWIDTPLQEGPPIIGYESVGNYVYTVSRREFEKLALGLDLPAVAFKSLWDDCPNEIEKIQVSPLNPSFVEFVSTVTERQRGVDAGLMKGNILFTIIFKISPESEILDLISKQANGWSLKFFPGNPHRKKAAS